jgi:hypothetical protein
MARNGLEVIARYYNEVEDYCLFVYDEEKDNAMIINMDCPSKSESLLEWSGYDAATYDLLHAISIEYVEQSYVDIFLREIVETEEDETLAYKAIKALMEFKEI